MVKYVKINDFEEFVKEFGRSNVFITTSKGISKPSVTLRLDGSTDMVNYLLDICSNIKSGVYSKKVELKPLTRPEFFEAVADGLELCWKSKKGGNEDICTKNTFIQFCDIAQDYEENYYYIVDIKTYSKE